MERVPAAVQCLMLSYLSASSIFRVEVVSRQQRRVVKLVQKQGILGSRVRERLRRRFSYGPMLVHTLESDPALASLLPVIGSFPLQAINGEDWTSVDGSDCDIWALEPDAGKALKRMLWQHHNIGAEKEIEERQAMLIAVAADEVDYRDAAAAYNFRHVGDPVLQIVSVECHRRVHQHHHIAGQNTHRVCGDGEIKRADIAGGDGDGGGGNETCNRGEIQRIMDGFDWDWCKCAWTPTRFVIDGKAAIRDRVGTHRRVYHRPMVRDYSQLLRRAMRYARRGYSGRFPDATLISLAAPSHDDTCGTSTYESTRLREESRRFQEFLGDSVAPGAPAPKSKAIRAKLVTALETWAAHDECRRFVYYLRKQAQTAESIQELLEPNKTCDARLQTDADAEQKSARSSVSGGGGGRGGGDPDVSDDSPHVTHNVSDIRNRRGSEPEEEDVRGGKEEAQVASVGKRNTRVLTSTADTERLRQMLRANDIQSCVAACVDQLHRFGNACGIPELVAIADATPNARCFVNHYAFRCWDRMHELGRVEPGYRALFQRLYDFAVARVDAGVPIRMPDMSGRDPKRRRRQNHRLYREAYEKWPIGPEAARLMATRWDKHWKLHMALMVGVPALRLLQPSHLHVGITSRPLLEIAHDLYCRTSGWRDESDRHPPKPVSPPSTSSSAGLTRSSVDSSAGRLGSLPQPLAQPEPHTMALRSTDHGHKRKPVGSRTSVRRATSKSKRTRHT